MTQTPSTHLFLGFDAPLRTTEWNELVTSLVMLSDVVWLKSTVQVSRQLPVQLQRHVEQALQELNESGLLRYWALSSDPEYAQSRAQRIIGRDEHMELYQSILGDLRSTDRALSVSIPRAGSDPELTSRIVEFRHAMWLYGIATLLRADRIAAVGHSKQTCLADPIMLRKAAIETHIVTKLLEDFEVSSMAHLTSENILNLGQKGKQYREEITKIADGLLHQSEVSGDTLSHKVREHFPECLSELSHLMEAQTGNGAIRGILKNTMFTLMGVLITPLSALSLGEEIVRWLRNRQRNSFMLFMLHLRKMTRRKQ